MVFVEPADPRDPRVLALLQASQALMQQLYPPEENFALSVDDLCGEGIHFFTAREGDEILGTGALAVQDTYAEVKAMFTTPEARGKGVAAGLIRQLEDHARSLDLTALKLETGEELSAAVRLYQRHGFTRCGAFGDYVESKYSIFMEKPL